MPAEALGQPSPFLGYGISIPDCPKTVSGPPVGAQGIFVPALCSATGLIISAPYLPLLSRAFLDESAFDVLSMLLR